MKKEITFTESEILMAVEDAVVDSEFCEIKRSKDTIIEIAKKIKYSWSTVRNSISASIKNGTVIRGYILKRRSDGRFQKQPVYKIKGIDNAEAEDWLKEFKLLRSKIYSNYSGYRGVYRAKSSKKPWTAKISVGYMMENIGYFKTSREAALAYNKAAKKYLGKKAMLNIIPDTK